MRATFSILFLLLTTVAYTQLATVQGTVTDAQGNSIPGVNIYDTSKTIQTNPSDRNGRYSIKIPTDRKVTLIFSFVGYQKVEKTFELKPNESIIFNPKLKTLLRVAVNAHNPFNAWIQKLRHAFLLPEEPSKTCFCKLR
jgi:hypothetical protein